jgi:hypothetical protein
MLTFVVLLPLLVCLVGLALYLVAGPEKPKVGECGRLMFFAGMLVTLLSHAEKLVKLL